MPFVIVLKKPRNACHGVGHLIQIWQEDQTQVIRLRPVEAGTLHHQYLLSFEQLEETTLDLIVAGTDNAVLMVESEAKLLSEEIMLGAVTFGHEAMQVAIRAINELVAEAGAAKRTPATSQAPVRSSAEPKNTVPKNRFSRSPTRRRSVPRPPAASSSTKSRSASTCAPTSP